MPKCPWCGSETAVAPFCAFCGRPLAASGASMTADIAATIDSPTPSPRPSSGRLSSSSSSQASRTQGRFLPGTLVAGRYRIVALLGRGGMGEVYRADDLSLQQQVALKFLPETATDDATLDRFRNEVRIARRISHPNVCRVYDIGEAEQHVFLTMEYIDGEDLASLLRRIGRLSGDKAAEIARKICAGLGAAHSQGVLHRDLKPANIMLNGEGEVLITDFGLAGLANEISDFRSGTPAYMAPEQLTGREVTAKSDVYSLGLVLYELFTGKRAFEGKTFDEIVEGRRDRTPGPPSTIVRDLDPAAERAILHCLEPDPYRRPSSALAVAAALPGGDPLAAALAAGETPSPQLVAAAGENIGLQPRAALTWLSIAILGMVAFYLLGIKSNGMDALDLPYTPQVLSQKARDMAEQLGSTAPPRDSAEWLSYDHDYLDFLDRNRPNWDERLRGRPAVLRFAQRTSPETLLALEPKDNTLLPGMVDRDDPPPLRSGMMNIDIDMRGKLTSFEAIPPQVDKANTGTKPYDWNQLFDLAGLDQSQFKTTEPIWNSLAGSDARAAWTGVWPGTNFPLRVEAASYKGRPVFFKLVGDWTKPTREQSSDQTSQEKVRPTTLAIVSIFLLIGAAALAYRNSRRGKSDVEGAIRLGVIAFVLQMALWICTAHFVASIGLVGLFVLAVAGSLFVVAAVCVLYLAIEPYVRRHWPQAIVSWTRLLAGRFRDPHVGRDLLYGVVLGITWGVIYQLYFFVLHRQGLQPALCDTNYLLGTRRLAGTWLWHLSTSVQGTLISFFIMFVLRALLRKPWLAAIAFVALFAGLKLSSASQGHFLLSAVTQLLIYGIAAFVVLRFGFISLAVGLFTADLILNIPITTHFSSWYAESTYFVLLTVLCVALWGCYTSVGGQKLWRGQLFE